MELERALAACAVAMAAMLALPLPAEAAAAAAPPNLAGTYRCEGYSAVCDRGRTFTLTQEGAIVRFQNENGETGTASLTGNISLLAAGPWNMMGVLLGGTGNVIQWSNGTVWRKEGT